MLAASTFTACSDGDSGNGDGGGGNSLVCTYYMKDDESTYYVFYSDKTVDYYTDGKSQYEKGILTYTGDPLKAGIVKVNVSAANQTLLTFTVKESDGILVPTVELVPGFPTEFTLKKGDESSGGNSGTGDNSSGDGNSSTVATYKNSDATAEDYEYIYFYSDDTFKVTAYEKEVEEGFTVITKLTMADGTYTGKPAADGTVTLTVKREADADWATLEEKIVAAVTAGKTSYTITNSDAPLTAVDAYTISAVVSGKTATITDEDGDTGTYTRQ